MTETTFSYSGTELEALADARNYYRWILGFFAPYLRGRVIEVGAGIGTFSRLVVDLPEVREALLIEPDPELAEPLAARFAARERVRTVAGMFAEVERGADADAIVVVNVMEHMQDDVGFVKEAYGALRDGGALCVFVPALPALYGTLDTAFDHYRRYTKAMLRQLLGGAGYQIALIRYVNMPGILSWFVAGRILRQRSIGPAQMRLYDRLMIPWISRVEALVPPPLGQNVLAVAVKGPKE